jgi:hypothetical protein
MWKHVRQAMMVGGAVGTALLWFSTNSIPETVSEADGIIARNLRYLGWDDPPAALATSSADNIATVVGAILVLLFALACISWVWERYMSKKGKGSGEPPPKSKGLIDGTEIEQAEWADNEVGDNFDSSRFTLIRGGKIGKLVAKGNRFGSAGKARTPLNEQDGKSDGTEK